MTVAKTDHDVSREPLFDQLVDANEADWRAYTEHPFVIALGKGTLPTEAFRTYLVQDYLFLIQFARAYALAVFKGRNLAEMRSAHRGVSAILDVEMSLHVELCAEWGLSEAELEATPEARATTAYTRFVIDTGLRGDLLDLHVALAPCVVGYAAIAERLEAEFPEATDPGNPYRKWIGEYAGDDYRDVAEAAVGRLDQLADHPLTARRFEALSAIFAQACRLEADFWQMGLDGA